MRENLKDFIEAFEKWDFEDSLHEGYSNVADCQEDAEAMFIYDIKELLNERLD